MARLINKTQSGFTVVAQNITKDERLGMKERGLLVTLLSLPDDWEYSVLGLTKILPDGRDAIQASVRKLEQTGYLKRVQSKNEKGKFAGYDWEVTDTPFTEEPFTEKPLTDNPSTDNPSAEKPPQLNTNESNIDTSNTDKSNTKKSINLSAEGGAHGLSEEHNDVDRLMDREIVKKIKEQIDYDVLCQSINEEDLSIAIDAIAALYMTTKPQEFNNTSVSPELIRQRAEQIDSTHVEYVFNCFYQNRTRIQNIVSYFKTAMFNAPSTIGAYYANAVRADQAI